jgi:tRNA nucleotidyltransferase/poly(A) polymerase/2'-5' RNA ligase
MTYVEFKEKILPEFLKSNSFAAKIKYASQYLPRIGSGTGRIVYDIDGQKIFKLAKNSKGVAQNEVEAGAGYYHDTHNIVAIVFESAEDESWLISEKAKKVNEARIKELTGIPSLNDLYYYVRNFNSSNHGRGNIFGQDSQVVEELNENEFAQELTEFIANYSQQPGDYGRPSTYGEVLRDGQPIIVLTDYGLNDEVYSTHYSPDRKNKPQYRMYELYNNNDGNDDILGDMPPQDAIDTRRGMWAQLPYSVDDGNGVINEGFISFILDRDKYPTRVLPSAPYIVDEFHNCVNNIDETLNHVKNKKKFYENLLKLQEYLIEQKLYDREPLSEIKYLNEDGSALYSTDKAMGQDNFPTHNNIDTSPSIENDLNANINIEEDLVYHSVVGDATEDQYMLDERKLSSMAGSSTVEVKQKCRLAGNGNTSTACNQGDINNLNIKPLKEEISAKEAYTDEGALKTVLNGKRKIGFIHLNKSIAQKLEKLKIGVIPIRMTSQNTMTAIIYRDKVKAYLLYEFTKRHGGYLDDKTPEEAREIGRLLEYKEEDIEDFIRKKYGIKVPLMPDKSPDDFNDLAESESFDFWDLNEENSLNEEKIRVPSMLYEGQIMALNYLPFREDVEEAGGKIYSVGGAVRDEFLGKESKDLDILITGVPFEKLEEILGKYGAVNAVGKSFGVLKFKPKGATEDIDIAIPRTETPTGEGGHQGFDVKSDHALPIEKDLERRDFTINAIAKDIDGNIIDPFGGQEDLKNKIIKVVNPQAFSDDPLRMLRAVQFASRFGFTIDPDTMKMIQKNAGRVKEIAPERILTEFDKIIKKGDKLTGALLLRDTGLLKEIFGNDAGGLDLGRNIWENVRTMGEFVYLLSKNLVSDPAEFYKNNLKGDENAYREIKALQIAFESGEATNLIEARSIAHNMYVISPTSLQSQILPNVIKTAAQEFLAGKYPKTVNELAVNGNDLMQAGLQGKAIGDMQKSLLLKIYANKVMNNKEDLLSLAGQNKTMIKEEVKERLEYGCLMLFLDVPAWSKITSVVDKNDLYIMGNEYGVEKEPHVTILYGFEDEVTTDEVFKLFKENAPLRPIEVRVKGISIFENPEFDVVKFDVNSDELTRLNSIMKQLPNTSTFPDYHAHITIAYVKKGEGKKYVKPFEKERILKGNELVYSWKGHTEKEEGNVLKLNEKNSLNEFAYPEVNANQNSTWDINGEQVGIPFFVEKYDIWNQGGYTDPSEASVLEFIQNNYEDFTHDEKLKKELLLALTDRNILDETVINEMSIKQINYDDVITPEYIKQIEMSDNFERFIEYYKYEYNLITHDNEEIEKTEDFKNWFKYELSARYDDAVERITNNLKPDGTIDIWRRITIDDEENRWISHLADAGKHLGIYWSWDERAAEAHWGNSAHNNDALIKSSIKEEYIDWRNTLYANMDMSLGEEEKEITLFKNTSLKIEELYVDDNDVMTSDFASVIKNKTFYA